MLEYDDSFDENFSITDEENRVLLQGALIATFYFKNGHLQQKKQAVLHCIKQYVQQCSQHLKWVYPSFDTDHSGYRAVSGLYDFELDDYLLNRDEDFAWEFGSHSGATAEEASFFCFEGFSRAKWKPKPIGYFKVAFPMTWFAEQPSSFADFVLDCCRHLHPYHGYGGIGLVVSPNRFLRSAGEQKEFSLAMQFPGLEIDHPISHLSWVWNGIKGVNWLTFFDNSWLDKINGIETLKDNLDDVFKITTYTNGVLIQAGEKPQVGSVNHRIMPEKYSQLSKLLKPIRITTHSGIHSQGPFNREKFEKWLAKFDE